MSATLQELERVLTDHEMAYLLSDEQLAIKKKTGAEGSRGKAALWKQPIKQ